MAIKYMEHSISVYENFMGQQDPEASLWRTISQETLQGMNCLGSLVTIYTIAFMEK